MAVNARQRLSVVVGQSFQEPIEIGYRLLEGVDTGLKFFEAVVCRQSPCIFLDDPDLCAKQIVDSCRFYMCHLAPPLRPVAAGPLIYS